MTLNVRYTETNSPVKAVEVINPTGFKNLVLTIDTVGGRKTPRTRRINISNGEVSVKLALDQVEDFIQALELLADYGIDQSAAA